MTTLIETKGLTLRSLRGTVFGPLDLVINDGITVLQGEVGSGRTTLLLTVSGRMRQSAGTATTLGFALPKRARDVQKRTGIAGFASIDDLDGMITVADAIRERRAWLSPWFSVVPKPDNDDVHATLRPVFGDRLVDANTRIWDLNESQHLKLKIVLALMARPSVLFVDSIEQIQSDESRQRIWAALSALHDERGISSVVTAASADTRLWAGLPTQPQLIEMNRKSATV